MTPLTDEHGWGEDTETAHQEGLTGENRALWDHLNEGEGTMEDRKDQPIKEDPQALKDVWDETLKLLKKLSVTRGLLAVPLVRKDQDLLKLLIFWSKIPMGRAIKQPPPDSQGLSQGELEASLDSWAWKQVTPKLSRLKKLMDHDSVKETRDLMTQGRSLSLIYPDGTVNPRVLTVLVSSEPEGIIDLVEKLKGKGES